MPRPPNAGTDPRTKEFVLLAKLRGSRAWKPVANPRFVLPHTEGYAVKMLENWSIEHVEWIDCGVVYRVVRRENVGAYRVE